MTIFCWDGDETGADYVAYSRKSNNSTALYPSCCSVAVHPLPRVNPFELPKVTPTSLIKLSSSPTDTPTTNGIITLSRCLRQLIEQISHASIIGLPSKRFAVADTGATNHMLPEKAAFISYKLVSNLQVRMGNNSFLPVLGPGTAVISLNGQHVLIRNALQVPGLVMPLYSLQAHLTQCGCAFYGTYAAGMLVCFPTFVLTADMYSDCHLSYEPLGCCAPLDILHYVQPRCPPTLYPLELAYSAPLSCKASHVPGPALIEDELGDLLLGDLDQLLVSPPHHLPVCGVLPAPQPTNPDTLNFSTISLQLTSLAKAISSNLSPLPPLPLPAGAPTCKPTLATPAKPPGLLSTLPRNAIIKLVHCEGTNLPSVCPCNTANALDTKTNWTLEELHWAMGCRKFRNYKLLQVSRDGKWMDGREFSASLGSYATIRKSNSGGPIDCPKYKQLDTVHMDIAFGDCLSVGGFRYALILVDRATRYNWAFGLKNLSLDAILDTIRLFCAVAGSLAQYFYCDCDLKLFGTDISEYLIDNDSKVVAAPAKVNHPMV
jgi:hypothetical protein